MLIKVNGTNFMSFHRALNHAQVLNNDITLQVFDNGVWCLISTITRSQIFVLLVSLCTFIIMGIWCYLNTFLATNRLVILLTYFSGNLGLLTMIWSLLVTVMGVGLTVL